MKQLLFGTILLGWTLFNPLRAQENYPGLQYSAEKVTIEIAVPSDRVWAVIGAVEGVHLWFAPIIQTSRVEGDKRYCTTKDGEFQENILLVDHANRTFKYAIPDQNMIPAKGILGTMKVMDSDQQNTKVEWSANFYVKREEEAMARTAFVDAWTFGIKGIENFLKNQKEK